MGAAAFRLFYQNERIFRDQALIFEMQQGARLIVAQIADDVRMAGQGIPPGLGELILPGSDSSRLNLRVGFSSTESVATSALPFPVAIGSVVTISLESTSGFSAGRQAFLWNENAWARVAISTVVGSSKSVRGMPLETSKSALVFVSPPALSLDEAVATYLDASTHTVRRTTANNTENPASPSWAPANELAANVSNLTMLYYDAAGGPLILDSALRRSQVAAIEARVTVRSSAALSNGSRPVFSLSVRANPRNMGLR